MDRDSYREGMKLFEFGRIGGWVALLVYVLTFKFIIWFAMACVSVAFAIAGLVKMGKASK